MRLICPNCGAQYEVTEDVIPTGGRDVQCSNCGHTWFETPGASEAAEAESPALRDDTPPAPAPMPDVADPEALSPAPQPAPSRPAIDPSVAEILREEAERETAARRTTSPDPFQSQTDLGLSDPPAPTAQEQRNIEAARRLARLKGEESVPVTESSAAAAAAAAAASRKEMLPDIEEINSTLRSSADRGEDIAPTPEEIEETKRRGFRFGYFFILLIILVLVLVYIFAAQVKMWVPSVADTIDTYVETVDSGRLWLDLKVQELTATIEDATAGEAAGE